MHSSLILCNIILDSYKHREDGEKARGVEHFEVITAFQDVFNNSWDRLRDLDVSVWKKEEGGVQNAKSLLVSR